MGEYWEKTEIKAIFQNLFTKISEIKKEYFVAF